MHGASPNYQTLQSMESIEEHLNLSNYLYLARIDWTNRVFIIGGRCNRLNFDFPIGSHAADNSE